MNNEMSQWSLIASGLQNLIFAIGDQILQTKYFRLLCETVGENQILSITT
jgi:hypothetical protein